MLHVVHVMRKLLKMSHDYIESILQSTQYSFEIENTIDFSYDVNNNNQQSEDEKEPIDIDDE